MEKLKGPSGSKARVPKRLSTKQAGMLALQGLVFGLLLVLVWPRSTRVIEEFPIGAFPQLGSESAVVDLVVFEDLLCPGCRVFALEHLPGLMAAFVDEGLVRLTTVPLPVVRPESTRVAQALLCVHGLDAAAYWEIKPAAYRARELGSLGTAEDLMRLVEQVTPGVPIADLVRCTDDPVTVQVVAGAVALARARGISSTPTVLVNGTVVQPTSAARAAELIRVALP